MLSVCVCNLCVCNLGWPLQGQECSLTFSRWQKKNVSLVHSNYPYAFCHRAAVLSGAKELAVWLNWVGLRMKPLTSAPVLLERTESPTGRPLSVWKGPLSDSRAVSWRDLSVVPGAACVTKNVYIFESKWLIAFSKLRHGFYTTV